MGGVQALPRSMQAEKNLLDLMKDCTRFFEQHHFLITPCVMVRPLALHVASQ
jgi:hypothetical protein